MAKRSRIDVGSIRREQIVEAAVAIIDAEGLPELSLSKIEKKTGMSRGQLTYYFPAKEDILLAVFDRLLGLMHERVKAGQGGANKCVFEGSSWEKLEHFLRFSLLQKPSHAEFHSLQYTFLSQIGHREDFRARLAKLYEDWRDHMATDFARTLSGHNGNRRVSPRALATLVQAILHGLAVQRAAAPDAFDGPEMLELCLEVLGRYLRPEDRQPKPTANANGSRARNKKRNPTRAPKGEP